MVFLSNDYYVIVDSVSVSVYVVSWQAWMQRWMEQCGLITTLPTAVSSQGILCKPYKTLASSPGVETCLSSTLNPHLMPVTHYSLSPLKGTQNTRVMWKERTTVNNP